MDSSKTKTEEK